MTSFLTPSQQKAIADLWDTKTKDTSDIALIVLGSRHFESVVANELARLRGETEPHPRAVSKSQTDNDSIRANLREIRGRRA